MRRVTVAVAALPLLVTPALAANAAPDAPATPPSVRAAAAGSGSTILVDRPSGSGAVPSDGINGSASTGPEAVSGNGRYVVFQSHSDALLPPDADPEDLQVFVRDRVAGTTRLVSANALGQAANNQSYSAVISGNGDRVAFVSTSSNLVNGVAGTNVYVKDLSDGSVVLVSRRTGAAGTPNSGFLGDPTISDDGTRVAWWTYTSLDAVDTNATTDVYQRDLSTNTTTLMSLNTMGAVGTLDARSPSIAGNGALVAFESGSPLVPSDTNSESDIYVRSGGVTGLVSANAAGNGPGNAASYAPSVDDSGITIAFGSYASNLLAPGLDANGKADVFLRDLGLDQTTLVSRPDGTSTGQFTGDSYAAAISGDGGRVGFNSGVSGGSVQAFVRTVSTNATTLVSRASGGEGAPGTGTAYSIGLNTNGTVAAFGGDFANLGAPDKDSDQVYVRDGTTTSLASRPTGVGAVAAGGRSSFVDQGLSDDGRLAVFLSDSDGLAANDTDTVRHVYLRDLSTNKLRTVTPGANGGSESASISADGRTVAFLTFATNVGAGVPGIYAYDVARGTFELATRRDGSAGAPLPPDEYSYAISGNGRRIAFSTEVAIDAAKDTNGVSDVYVRDLDKNTTRLVSRVNGAGTAAGNGGAYQPSLDMTGNRVAYSTSATNMGDGDTTPAADIHLRDLTSNTTTLVSRPSASAAGGDADSRSASISGDGKRVAFSSNADNLAGAFASEQVFLRDLATGTTRLVSRVGAAGAAADGTSRAPDLSTDGGTVAFETTADNLGAVGGVSSAVVVRTLATGGNVVASRANGASGGLATSANNPAVNGNGRCVLFQAGGDGFSSAYPSPDFSHVYLRVVRGECPMDTTAPAITKAKIKPKAFKAKSGTKVRFKLSEAAKVSFKAGKIKLTKRAKAGKNTFKFKGKKGRKTLKPGTYRLVIQATDAAGNKSKKVKLKFTVLR